VQLAFGLVLQKNSRLPFSFGFTKLTAVSVFSVRLGLHSSVDVIFHSCLYGMMLEMTYFRAELVELIVRRSDSELKGQRYGMKKYVDCWFCHATRRICEWDNLKNRRQTAEVSFFENRTAETAFSVLNVEVSSVFRKPISDVFIGFRTSLITGVRNSIWQHLLQRSGKRST